jgi:hypothetical protein
MPDVGDGLYPRLVSIGLNRMTGLFEDLFGGETLGGGRAKDGTAAASEARRRIVFVFMTRPFLFEFDLSIRIRFSISGRTGCRF